MNYHLNIFHKFVQKILLICFFALLNVSTSEESVFSFIELFA